MKNLKNLLIVSVLSCLIGIAANTSFSEEANSTPLIGSWGGPLVIGEDDLGLIFTFAMKDGDYSASMISDGMGIYGMPADKVRVNGLALTVVIRRLNVEFTGTLRFDESGEELLRIDANWFQDSEMVPVVLRPVEE